MSPLRLLFATGLLLAAALGACDCAIDEVKKGVVTFETFEIVETEPPFVVRDGAREVPQGAKVTLQWKVRGPMRRVVLAANDLTIADFGAQSEGIFEDDCADAPCGTAALGEVRYSLTAIGAGEASSDTRSLLLRVVSP